MGASLLAINHFKPDVERFAEDYFLSLLRAHIVFGDVANVGFVLIKQFVVHRPNFPGDTIIVATA